jgi:uncharacterized membrane protein YqjE
MASQENPNLRHILRDLLLNGTRLAQSELRLARVEIIEQGKAVTRESGKSAFSAVLLWLGFQCFIAFSIIGLGVLLNERYWLSALIVSAIFLGIGVFGLLTSARRISREAKLPALQNALEMNRELGREIQRKKAA